MNLLRRFVLAGALATATDVGLLLALRFWAGWSVPLADAVAVAAATAVSWILHSLLTLPRDPSKRWFSNNPGRYLGTAGVALVVDVAVITMLDQLLAPGWWAALLVIKLPALTVALLVRSANYRRAMFTEVRQDQARRVPRPSAPGGPRLSVVVPAYREVDRIADTVRRLRSELGAVAAAGGLEVVVVDDGSDDDTAAAARAAGADIVVEQRPNRGKGAAVRAGALVATGRTVAFTDADLSYAPAQLVGLLTAVEDGSDVVVGSRQHTDTLTVVRAGRLREVGGRLVNVLTGIVLLGRYRDTQCGIKAMRSDVALLLFGQSQVDGFAFDVELFHLVERYRLTLSEVPVEVVNSSRSTVHVVRDASRLVRDLFAIRRAARAGRYDVADEALPPTLSAGVEEPPGPGGAGRGPARTQH
jgi:dolichyl-phosphate beta-glucosyltransferase